MSVQLTGSQWAQWVGKFFPSNHLSLVNYEIFADGQEFRDVTNSVQIEWARYRNPAVLVVSGSIRVTGPDGVSMDESLEDELRRWLQQQTMTRISLQVANEDIERLPAVFKAAGIRYLS